MRQGKDPPPGPIVVGLLGGIASGKSVVSGILEEAGWIVIDADVLAREVLESPELRPQLVELFGPEIQDSRGALDRRRIAAAVFDDPAKRRELERLTHPPVRQRILARLAASLAAGRSVVLDVPLLLERGLLERCDHVLFIDAPDAVRCRRAAARGLDEADWRRREASQAPLAEKRRRADRVIDNSGTIAETRRQLAVLVARQRQ